MCEIARECVDLHRYSAAGRDRLFLSLVQVLNDEVVKKMLIRTFEELGKILRSLIIIIVRRFIGDRRGDRRLD